MTVQGDLSGLSIGSTELFGDLPEALINELLANSDRVSINVKGQIDNVTVQQKNLRERAEKLGLICSLPDMSSMPFKSVGAVDGSHVTVNLASFDLSAAAALGVDGLGFGRGDVDGDLRNYEFECHITDPLPHGTELAYALMFCMEYEVANCMEHDLVMLDGAFSTGMVAISIGLKSIGLQNDLSNALRNRWFNSVREMLPEILVTDRLVALPKRNSSNEFVTQTMLFNNNESDVNGRTVASLILNSDEYTVPFRLETHGFYIGDTDLNLEYVRSLNSIYDSMKVVYFKPYDWTPALRIEFTPGQTDDVQSLHEKLEMIKLQCVSPAILEPYPLYVADRFVKSLSKGVSALLQAVRNDVAHASDDPDLAMRMMYAHRTDPAPEMMVE